MPEFIGTDTSLAKKATCKHCGSVYKYMPHEVRVLAKGRDIDQTGYVIEGFNCGNCGKEIITHQT